MLLEGQAGRVLFDVGWDHDDAALLEPLELVVLAHCSAKKVALAEASPRTTLAAVGQRYRL